MFRPGFYNTEALRALVARYVDPPLLYAVRHRARQGPAAADRHHQSRYRADGDLGHGAIASRGDAASLKLFQDVLVASASIPGVFPPTLIEVEGQGRKLSEMHVDGGVIIPFFVAPEALMLWTPRVKGDDRPGHVRVIVNGKIGGGFAFTRGGTLSIISRAWETMSQALMRTHLAASAAFSRRSGGQLQFAAIPDDAAVDTSGLDFTADNRQALFRLGYDSMVAGSAWRTPDIPVEPAAATQGSSPPYPR
nr:patatin-like phospholipase family protein [Caulobacter sp. B11]